MRQQQQLKERKSSSKLEAESSSSSRERAHSYRQAFSSTPEANMSATLASLHCLALASSAMQGTEGGGRSRGGRKKRVASLPCKSRRVVSQSNRIYRSSTGICFAPAAEQLGMARWPDMAPRLLANSRRPTGPSQDDGRVRFLEELRSCWARCSKRVVSVPDVSKPGGLYSRRLKLSENGPALYIFRTESPAPPRS